MTILSSIILRHREPGYLRFSLPAEWITPEHAESLKTALTSEEGIYSVRIYLAQGKIAIRYLNVLLEESRVLTLLSSILKRVILPKKSTSGRHSKSLTSPVLSSNSPARTQEVPSFSVWIRDKITEIKETIQAIKILGSRGLKSMGERFSMRPRWAKEFMNDLLMLFLIKLHWEHLVYEWLPRPWAHRYEWAATIYLIYLSVQSKTAAVA